MSQTVINKTFNHTKPPHSISFHRRTV